MNCQKDQKRVVTLPACPPLSLSRLPQLCYKISFRVGRPSQSSVCPRVPRNRPAAAPAVVWLPQLQGAPQKEADCVPKQLYTVG